MKNIQNRKLLKVINLNKLCKHGKDYSYGITLITLVITIVLLLILAGITINLSLGQNGIFNRAQQAKENYSQSAAREKLETVLMEAAIEKETNRSYNNHEFLDNMLKEKGITVNENSVIVDNYSFVIDRDKLEIVTSNGEVLIKLGKEIQKYKGKNANNKYEVEILLKIESNKELQSIKIEKADGTQIQVSLAELKEGKNITIELDEKYEVTCVTSDGQIQARKLFESSEETIRTAEELSEFRDKVNSGLTYEGKTIKLSNDIDLSGVCGKNINGKEEIWNPIGYWISYDDFSAFCGTFNGQYNTIKNLYINIDENNIERYINENVLHEYNYFGLFSYTLGKIENVTMENVYIYVDLSNSSGANSYSQYIGSIVASAEHGEIKNVGIKSGSITSINTAQSSATNRVQFVGGLVGEAYNSNIYNSYNNAHISVTNFEHDSFDIATRNMVGGIAGRLDNNSHIKNCYNIENIEGNNALVNYIGGIAGLLVTSTIENSYNCGKILGTNSNTTWNCLGGIVGRNGNSTSLSNKGTIINSYRTGASAACSFYEYNINNPKNDGRVTYSALQGYSLQLGDAFTNDVQNTDGSYKYNYGLPTLKWQIPENR